MLPEDDDDGFAWPDEPREFDPDSLGPDAPAPPPVTDYANKDVPTDVANAFWAAVLFANVGLIGVTLGPMLWYFRGWTDVGGGLTLTGVLAILMTYRRYYAFMNRKDDADPESEDADPTGGD